MSGEFEGLDLSGLPDQPEMTEEEMLTGLPDQPESFLRAAPREETPGRFMKIWNDLASITKEDPKVMAARAQNAIALSDMLGIRPSEAYENHDEIARELDLKDSMPSGFDMAGYALLYPMATAFMSHPVTAGLGLAAYQALAEAESWAISKSQDQKYRFLHNRGLSSLLPEDTNEVTRGMVDLFDILGKGAIVGGAARIRKPLMEKFTKQITTEYNLPKDVYIPAKAIKSIFQTGEHISPAELDLVTSLGLDAAGYREAIKSGLWVRVPGERIVSVTDLAGGTA
jgi:hypothetical protein